MGKKKTSASGAWDGWSFIFNGEKDQYGWNDVKDYPLLAAASFPQNPGRFESNLPLVRRQPNESISKIHLYGFLLVQRAAPDTWHHPSESGCRG